MIGYGDDETYDERIRCGRHGRRDAGASPGQGPGVVCSRADIDDDDDGDDDDEYEHGGSRRLLRRRAGQAAYDDIHLAWAEGLAEDQPRNERRQQGQVHGDVAIVSRRFRQLHAAQGRRGGDDAGDPRRRGVVVHRLLVVAVIVIVERFRERATATADARSRHRIGCRAVDPGDVRQQRRRPRQRRSAVRCHAYDVEIDGDVHVAQVVRRYW